MPKNQENLIDVDVQTVVTKIKKEIQRKERLGKVTQNNLVMTEPFIEALDQLHNPEIFVRKSTRGYLIKKIVLRVFRVYTKVQIEFNKRTVFQLRDILEKLKHLKSFEDSTKKYVYKSKYFDEVRDRFYIYQQKLFRGSYEDIYNRQKKYLTYLKEIPKKKRDLAFLDIGCGRGEFLELLEDADFKNVVGIDINEAEIKRLKYKGFKAINIDAIEYLEKFDQKLIGVSSFQVVEHMTFEEVYDLLYLSYCQLVKGGILIIETPNIENLLVSSNSYYLDHTHKTKFPPMLLKSLINFIGFKKVNILYSSPAKKSRHGDIENLLYGYCDYAIIAYK